MNYEMLNELQDLIDRIEELYNRTINGGLSFAKSLQEVEGIIDEFKDLDMGDMINHAESEEEATQAVRLSYRFKSFLKKFINLDE